ncbi:MAG: UbiD family decarboxylase [Chloroflexi bacterium]|nr:UbiD family decarboxylase [Chloroflexota bacterium]
MTQVAAPPTIADLHTFLEQYERDYPDEVLHIEQPLDSSWELTALATKLEKAKRFPVLVFHNVIVDGERAELPLVTFLMASRQRLARAMGVGVREAGIVAHERIQARLKPIVVGRTEAPIKEVIQKGADIDLLRFPAPLHHRMDPGRYITEGLFLTHNRTSRLDNSAMQRGWISGRDEIRVFLGPSTHNWHNLREFEDAGEDMPAAYWVGHHPLALLGSTTRVGVDESHYEAGGGTLGQPLRLVSSETLGEDFMVPADAEIVIEGYVPRGKRAPEGPFGEYTRYVGPQRWGPMLKVTAVTRRRNAYWDDVMVGHTHWISSLANEGLTFRAVQRAVPTVRGVHIPMSGGGVTHAYVSIRKVVEGQGKVAAVAALNAFFATKHVFVFDEDVDIFDEKEVLLALAQRFQGDRGLVMIPGITGSPLDPSSADGMTTTKMGFDCTKPFGTRFAERLAVPDEVLSRIDPFDIIGRERLERIPIEPWG